MRYNNDQHSARGLENYRRHSLDLKKNSWKFSPQDASPSLYIPLHIPRFRVLIYWADLNPLFLIYVNFLRGPSPSTLFLPSWHQSSFQAVIPDFHSEHSFQVFVLRFLVSSPDVSFDLYTGKLINYFSGNYLYQLYIQVCQGVNQ